MGTESKPTGFIRHRWLLILCLFTVDVSPKGTALLKLNISGTMQMIELNYLIYTAFVYFFLMSGTYWSAQALQCGAGGTLFMLSNAPWVRKEGWQVKCSSLSPRRQRWPCVILIIEYRYNPGPLSSSATAQGTNVSPGHAVWIDL